MTEEKGFAIFGLIFCLIATIAFAAGALYCFYTGDFKIGVVLFCNSVLEGFMTGGTTYSLI